MPKIFNLGNHNVRSPNDCNAISPVPADLRNKMGGACSPTDLDPCQDIGRKKKIGFKANCDPELSGSIINDITETPNRNIINRYSSSFRGCDQGVTDLFRNFVVLDDDGKAWPVPVIWGSQEKAVAVILQNNVRKDNTGVVNRLTLPMLAVANTNIEYARERFTYHKAKLKFKKSSGQPSLTTGELLENDTVYGISRGAPVNVGYTVYAWTQYTEDMMQILEQLYLKFNPMAYIKIQNNPWEIPVTLDTVANNIEYEPGDKSVRLVKYQFNLTAQTYISSPITRNKTVLKIKTDFFNATSLEEINQVYGRDETETT